MKSPWYVLCKANYLVRRSIYASPAEPHIQGVSWDFAIMKYLFLSSTSAAWKVALMIAYIATHTYRGSIFAVQDLRKSPKKQFVKSHKVTEEIKTNNDSFPLHLTRCSDCHMPLMVAVQSCL